MADVQLSHFNYITKKGLEELQREHDYLWNVDRPKVVVMVSEAAAMGDRSENAEYQYGKRRLAEIDRRVRYLRKQFKTLVPVEYSPQQEGRVFFGAWVECEREEDGEVFTYRIVGADEAKIGEGHVTLASPFGRAVLGKAVDDDFVVHTPKGPVTYYVNKIWYEKD